MIYKLIIQYTHKINCCAYKYMHTHIYIYIYIYMCVCVLFVLFLLLLTMSHIPPQSHYCWLHPPLVVSCLIFFCTWFCSDLAGSV